MKILKEFTDRFKDIPQESLDLFVSLASKQTFQKDEFITNFNEISTNFYIIKTGIVKSFYVDDKGKQYIRSIFTANQTTGSLNSLLSGKPSILAYDCITDCVVYKVNYKDFMELTKTDIGLSNLYARILEYVFSQIEIKVYNLAILNATERYIKLKKEIPNIENIIPQYDIASYLNISAVQLSRIRKKLYSK